MIDLTINTDLARTILTGFIKTEITRIGFFRAVLGLSGGILVVLIIINGYKLMASQGDPEKIKEAREGIIAAIAGILMIIFSLSLLTLLTRDILGLPGFK